MFTCNYCNNEFISQSVLKNHQKTASYCLDKQGKQSKKFHCTYCEKKYSDKRSLNNHENKCIKYRFHIDSNIINEIKLAIIEQKGNSELIHKLKERIIYLEAVQEKNIETINRQEQYIKDLTTKLENVAVVGAKKHSNTNTNNIINLEVLSEAHLLDSASKLTKNDVLNIENLAHFALNNSFKNRLIATDRSRKTFSYKNEDGLMVKDPKGLNCSKIF
jgi:hypothetical protein